MSDDLAAQLVAVLSRIVPKLTNLEERMAAHEERLAALDERMAAHERGLAASRTTRTDLGRQVSEQLSTLAGSLGK